MEFGAKNVFLSCPCFIFSVDCTLYSNIRPETGLLGVHKHSGVCLFSIKEKRENLSIQFICSKPWNSGEPKADVPDTTKFPTALHFGR